MRFENLKTPPRGIQAPANPGATVNPNVPRFPPAYKGMWEMYRDGVTQSMLNRFLSCPEKFRLSYLEGKEPIDRNTEAMDFGTIFHESLDLVYSAFRDADNQTEFLVGLEKVIEKAVNDRYDQKFEDIQVGGGTGTWETLDFIQKSLK